MDEVPAPTVVLAPSDLPAPTGVRDSFSGFVSPLDFFVDPESPEPDPSPLVPALRLSVR